MNKYALKFNRFIFGSLNIYDLGLIFIVAIVVILVLDYIIYQSCSGAVHLSSMCSHFGLKFDFIAINTAHTPEALRPYYQSARWHHLPILILIFAIWRLIKNSSKEVKPSNGQFWVSGIILFIFLSPIWHVIHNILMSKLGVDVVN